MFTWKEQRDITIHKAIETILELGTLVYLGPQGYLFSASKAYRCGHGIGLPTISRMVGFQNDRNQCQDLILRGKITVIIITGIDARVAIRML